MMPSFIRFPYGQLIVCGCADRMFDAKNRTDSVFKHTQLTRVLTQTEPLDVGIPSTTPDSLTTQSNRLREWMAGDTEADAALDQHPSGLNPGMQM